MAPVTERVTATVPAVGATTTADQIVAESHVAGKVTAVTYTPEAAITGHDTNTRTLTLVNKGQSGSGSTVIGTLAFVASNNGVAFDEKAFTLSSTAADLVVAAGDILVFVSTYAASGLADPGGRVEVEITRTS
jgi:YD repeat-containing protein